MRKIILLPFLAAALAGCRSHRDVTAAHTTVVRDSVCSLTAVSVADSASAVLYADTLEIVERDTCGRVHTVRATKVRLQGRVSRALGAIAVTDSTHAAANSDTRRTTATQAARPRPGFVCGCIICAAIIFLILKIIRKWRI